jgi:hypothetical protein
MGVDVVVLVVLDEVAAPAVVVLPQSERAVDEQVLDRDLLGDRGGATFASRSTSTSSSRCSTLMATTSNEYETPKTAYLR